MSAAILCDQCGATLAVDSRGEDEAGEVAGWLRLSLANHDYDLCTRSCLRDFLERDDVVAAHDEWLETITGIARAIRGDDDDEAQS